ncbi:MAG TPA: cold shock domain-containing protein [Candidatus Limnocylindrales bacterium]
MAIGIVKRVEPSMGSGLIASEDGCEYYFHKAGIKRPLTFDDLFGGERVQFQIETHEDGPRAIEICKTSRN